ncbi:MAG: proline--tRNA ligase [Gammaproteobacteria bacterium]|jgi:prolyl-tRNA synthetase|nr:proline--tRNA ligase [Gammaproteobacteria bacterium]MBT7753609.1 proline--tRNA ligase [Gammaproteobacteria bacterium]MDG2434122.1 proline--tRNA ligase [Gammaproteobacteria bacterium]
MKLSQYPLRTYKDSPAEAELTSHRLMLRSGLIKKLASGLFTWMPLGLKVLKKIENIVRDEMNATGAFEILMPAIQPSDLWEETGRWDEYGSLLLKMNDRHDRSFCFGPTHEEVITDIVRNELNTYKQLPVNFYQIQTKFRDEIRPRYGVMRAREFLMKDSYSFHLDQASLNEEYKKIGQAYDNIFNKLGLDYRKVRADSGEIGGSTSHEYHVLAESGEDEIGYCDEENFAANVETIKSKNAPNGGHLSFARGIEVGHIFQLGDKYSRSMKCNVLDNSGKSVDLMMGCYGIGISRIVAASIEQNHDKSGIIWPKEITPFKIIIIAILKKDDDTVLSKSNQLYDSLVKSGHEVALDDRNERAGVKFAEAELIGIPYQIIVSERGLNNNTVELVERTKNGSQDIDINTIKDYF